MAAIQTEEFYYVPIIPLALGLNTTVLIVIHHQTEIQDVMRFLYQIMAGINLLLVTVWGLWSMLLFSFHDQRSCTIMSSVFPFPVRTAVICSMACHCGISLNLYLLISRPLRYHVMVNLARVRIVAIVVFALIFLMNSIYLPLPFLKPFFNYFWKKCMQVESVKEEMWVIKLQAAFMIAPACLTVAITTFIYIKLFLIGQKKKRAVCNIEVRPRNIANVIEHHADDEGKCPVNVPGCLAGTEKKSRGLQFVKWLQCRRKGNHMVRMEPSKGMLTVLIITGSSILAYAPYVICHSILQNPAWHRAIDKFAISMTWVEPLAYLITNQEARRLLRRVACGRHREEAVQI